MTCNKPDTDLRELAEDIARFEPFFESLGFKRWDEPTTDFVRKIRWLHNFLGFDWPDDRDQEEPTATFLLVLSVEYELTISDVPDVPGSANFNYYFEGVRLELRDSRTNEPLGTSPLNITTSRELKAFLAALPPARQSAKHM